MINRFLSKEMIDSINFAITAYRGSKHKGFRDSLLRFQNKDLVIIERTMRMLVTNKFVDKIYFGGARGGDTVALYYALKHRTNKKPTLIVVVPVNLGFQPKETIEISRRADLIVEMNLDPFDSNGKIKNEIYRERNRKLLGDVKTLISFWNGLKMYSGTFMTMNMARNEFKIPVIVYGIEKIRNKVYYYKRDV